MIIVIIAIILSIVFLKKTKNSSLIELENNMQPKILETKMKSWDYGNNLFDFPVKGVIKMAITFCHNQYYNSAKKNCCKAIKAGFSSCKVIYFFINLFLFFLIYGMDELDDQWKKKNSKTLKCSTGAGYWLWKPYIILQSLKQLKDGDILFYSDAGSYINNKPDYLFKCVIEDEKGIVVFSQSDGATNAQYSKEGHIYSNGLR